MEVGIGGKNRGRSGSGGKNKEKLEPPLATKVSSGKAAPENFQKFRFSENPKFTPIYRKTINSNLRLQKFITSSYEL